MLFFDEKNTVSPKNRRFVFSNGECTTMESKDKKNQVFQHTSQVLGAV